MLERWESKENDRAGIPEQGNKADGVRGLLLPKADQNQQERDTRSTLYQAECSSVH